MFFLIYLVLYKNILFAQADVAILFCTVYDLEMNKEFFQSSFFLVKILFKKYQIQIESNHQAGIANQLKWNRDPNVSLHPYL